MKNSFKYACRFDIRKFLLQFSRKHEKRLNTVLIINIFQTTVFIFIQLFTLHIEDFYMLKERHNSANYTKVLYKCFFNFLLKTKFERPFIITLLYN